MTASTEPATTGPATTGPAITGRAPAGSRQPLISMALYRLEVRRVLRDRVTLFFTTMLPAFLYYIFGASQSWGSDRIGNGNVAMTVMIAMGAYGAVSTTVGLGASAAVERSRGWGRQLGLTPLRDRTFVATKVAVGASVAAVPIALIYGLGALTGARGTATTWLLSAAILVLGCLVFALYGLSFGLAFRSEAAVSAAGGSVVILGFLGNIFFPLSGAMLALAKLTPLYGYAAVARYPLTQGYVIDGIDGGDPVKEALWIPLLNLGVWTTLMAIVAIWLVRRGRGRQ